MGADMDRKLIDDHLKDNELSKSFKIGQIKKYLPIIQTSLSFFCGLKKAFINYTSDIDDEKSILGVYPTEIISLDDPRAATHEMEQTKISKVKELLDRDTIKVVDCDQIPADESVLPGKFVLKIKSDDKTLK